MLWVTADAAGEYRFPVKMDAISTHVVDALIAAEDRRFFEHGGVDVRAVARATLSNLEHRRVVSGASTITMQVAKILEPGERSLVTKMCQARRARQLERALDKRAILELYLNDVPFGGRLRGIEAAARHWFAKSAKELAVDEAATLIGMLPAPSRRRPDRAPDGGRRFRDEVLDDMRARGSLSVEGHRAAISMTQHARARPWPAVAPHACVMALAASREREVRTTIDGRLHRAVLALVARHDVPGADGLAIVVLDRHTGDLLDLIGARDASQLPQNDAVRRRDAGSTLKPFLFALALDRGIAGPETLLFDEPARYGGYEPQDFDRAFRGRMRTSDALTSSRNVPAVRLLHALGPPAFIDVLRSFGLSVGAADMHLAAALGTTAVSPLELAHAYRRFAGGANEPSLGLESRRRTLTMLEDAWVSARIGPGRCAWKTGTSSGRRDAWSVGVTEDRIVVVWRGRRDGGGAANLVGHRAALPLMIDIVASAAHARRESE